jgi:hypothetical protein
MDLLQRVRTTIELGSRRRDFLGQAFVHLALSPTNGERASYQTPRQGISIYLGDGIAMLPVSVAERANARLTERSEASRAEPRQPRGNIARAERLS